MSTYGQLVRNARQERKLTLQELADKSGISPSFLCQIEVHNKSLSPSTREVLNKTLGLTGNGKENLLFKLRTIQKDVANLITYINELPDE